MELQLSPYLEVTPKMMDGLQVHERTLQGDFLMALLKDIVILRRAQGNPLKVSPPPTLHSMHPACS